MSLAFIVPVRLNAIIGMVVGHGHGSLVTPRGGRLGPWFGKGVERLDHLFQAAKINLPSFYC